MEDEQKNLKEKIFFILGILFFIFSFAMIFKDVSSFLIMILFSLVFFICSKGFLYKVLVDFQEKILNNINNKNIEQKYNELQEKTTALKEEIKALKDSKNSIVKKNEEEIEILQSKKKELNTDINFLVKQKNEINLDGEIFKLKQIQSETKDFQNKKKEIFESISKLQFQKEMLLSEIDELEDKQQRISQTINNTLKLGTSELSIEYIDALGNGFDFEQCFATILGLLGYSDISITSGSGDFGIDVLANNDGILYGFQCKLYSTAVGNDAIQQAYAGRNHYNCNIAVVVTNNYFTDQAKKQAQENRVILWDRNTLKEKIRKANKKSLQFK
jgi:HJR/Mrr/RecB family endonuclease/cell division protein FtsB